MKLEPFEPKHAADLSNILNTDSKLLAELEMDNQISENEFLEQTNSWIAKNNSKSFAIIENEQVIGLISLSHINSSEKTAQIGYWLTSDSWNKGFGTQAFGALLDIARDNEIETVKSTILKTSIASLKIWQKFGATAQENPADYQVELKLKS